LSRRGALLVCLGVLLVGCGSGNVAPPTDGAPTPTRAAAALLTPTQSIQPVRFPSDEAPHDMLTEWWYYTGHLYTPDGRRYGFEYVIFQANRGAFPPIYAAHFAITDNPAGTFHYAEKTGQRASTPTAQGFELRLDTWQMSGGLGVDQLSADMPGYAIALNAQATKPPALHNTVGYVDFGPAGGSYYYSRTRMQLSGTLTLAGQPVAVTGEAWMDHQWGNFIAVGAGGWDWFSVQLKSGEDLTVSIIRGADGAVAGAYGTLVGADGAAQHLDSEAFEVSATRHWTSPVSGATYPSGWTLALPDRAWSLTLTPSLADQELRTTASTGVIYWEGEVLVAGTVAGAPADGLGYVELTGYSHRAP
jgi:predicted secreted hydrolase